MDDSALYTGVDSEPESGVFGNEEVSKDTEKLLQDQRQQLAELSPKLVEIIAMIDSEREIAISFISDYVDNSSDDDSILRGELKAAARYRKYLDTLKTKFTLALQETRKK